MDDADSVEAHAEEQVVEAVSDVQITHEPEEHHEEETTVVSEPEEPEPEAHPVVQDEPVVEPVSETAPTVDAPHTEVEVAGAITDTVTDVSAEPHATSEDEDDLPGLPDSPSPSKGENLEDIVSMLESGMPAPIKFSVPEDVAATGEIPDEE